MQSNNQTFGLLLRQPVVPVVTLDDPVSAVALARALSDAGLPVIEVTLRTDAALAAIKAVAEALAGRAVVGAGTVRSPAQADAAIAAGAAFLVSPGVTPSLIEAAMGWRVPFLPGVATASEAMALADMGYGFQKFFPAEQAGGAAALKSLAAPLPDIAFCPTGGIHAGNAMDYLSLDNVVCVGGSWVAPADLIAAGDWAAIGKLAAAAAALAG
ncbi:MAG: bifunctional 4-hydroxy-2-oxoglutarate aldolase/2-dehydro-3-deoxy-phosphogluconate aldolase [Hyphomicrobiaceae bacterium]